MCCWEFVRMSMQVDVHGADTFFRGDSTNTVSMHAANACAPPVHVRGRSCGIAVIANHHACHEASFLLEMIVMAIYLPTCWLAAAGAGMLGTAASLYVCAVTNTVEQVSMARQTPGWSQHTSCCSKYVR